MFTGIVSYVGQGIGMTPHGELSRLGGEGRLQGSPLSARSSMARYDAIETGPLLIDTPRGADPTVEATDPMGKPS
jgi:hypothetical protein